ncbi:hypothetical protein [Shewanella colwelliana]|uniref:hypothetical protein n=1 Tax=Shewanella colwelliana TaxID=23 RepID=UPI001C7DF09B|nr:hypothetical protein [Shewanella colwelliana]
MSHIFANLLAFFTTTLFGLILLLTAAVPNTSDATFRNAIDQANDSLLSFNRYQATYFCKQRRWEFCQRWANFEVTRLA